MRAAVYARVSSIKQRDEQTIESQLRDVPAWAAAQGWSVVATYVDDGRSAGAGKLAARDGLARLVAAAEDGAFDVVAVASVDRLTRSEDPVERAKIVASITTTGCKLAVVGAGIQDPSTFAGDAYLSLQALFAAEWRRSHRARVKAGKLTAISRGGKPAGPTPYGYTYDRAAKAWGVDEHQAAIVREVFARLAAGATCDEIAADLNAAGSRAVRGQPWTRHRVWSLTRRPYYHTGRWPADKARGLTVAVPALLDAVTWDAAHAVLIAAGKRGLRRTRHVYLLEGLATCGLCGARVHIQSATGGYPWAQYVCSRRKVPVGEPCTAPRVATAALDARLWDELAELVACDRIAEGVARRLRDGTPAIDATAQANRARLELARLDRAEALLLERVDRITPAALDRQLASLAAARTAAQGLLRAAEEQARAQRVTLAAVATLDEALADLRAAMPLATPAERRELAGILLGDVEIGAEAIAATVHLPHVGLSLARRAGSSAATRERVEAGRLLVALPSLDDHRRRAA